MYVSFAKEPYKRDDILQKRRIIWGACGCAHSLIMGLIENMVYCTCRVMHVLVRMHDYGCMHVGVQLHVQLHMDTYRYAEG